jgi:hypothetical protein
LKGRSLNGSSFLRAPEKIWDLDTSAAWSSGAAALTDTIFTKFAWSQAGLDQPHALRANGNAFRHCCLKARPLHHGTVEPKVQRADD